MNHKFKGLDMSKFSAYRQRAVYAVDPENCRGRRIPQKVTSERSPFQRDKDRIIHSSAFRRLKGKTQVFVAHEGDYYRTRLTHSLEVSQIARSISRVLGLDEDLSECLALAHDLGHPPFGHSGEDALSAGMMNYGGFNHNANTLRIVEHIEGRYAEFDGLNLTWETLEGIAKHNGPLIKDKSDTKTLPWALVSLDGWQRLDLHTFASAEAQVAAIADDIAYNNHDIDDGLRAGLFSIKEISEVPIVGETFAKLKKKYPLISENRLIHEVVRDMIGFMVKDVLTETRLRLNESKPNSSDEIRHLGYSICDFSESFREKEASLRKFLYENMYRHFRVNRTMGQARRIVKDLFELFLSDPSLLPTELQKKTSDPNSEVTARVVCDYIAGMTDNYAINEHKQLYSTSGYI
jgi:dGTPase